MSGYVLIEGVIYKITERKTIKVFRLLFIKTALKFTEFVQEIWDSILKSRIQEIKSRRFDSIHFMDFPG